LAPVQRHDGTDVYCKVLDSRKPFDLCNVFDRGRPPSDSEQGNMKIGLNIVGVILVIFGSIWFLQGINVLPGSFMTGQIRWAIIGGITIAAGAGLLIAINRRRLDGSR